MEVYSELRTAFLEVLNANPSTELAQARLYWNSVSKKPLIYDGTAWRDMGGGGGGGGSAAWFAPDGLGALEEEANGEKIYLFESGLDNEVDLWVKVPTSYSAGDQIAINIGLYSVSAANTILLESTSYLIRKDTDAVTSTTNSHASTNSALTNTVSNMYREAQIDITDASGEINSVAVSPGDLIRVKLVRGTDTDTADINFVPSATEILFSV